MSTITASNFSDGTDTVESEYLVHGSAKAWVNFNGTGTIAARDSLNVSSLTDNGTGDYTVSVTSAMTDADYCVFTCGITEINARGLGGLGIKTADVSTGVPQSQTASQVRIGSAYGSSGTGDGAATDSNACHAAFLGDLA